MDIIKFKKLPILGILRGIEENQIQPLIETISASGLETIEITMNTLSAPSLISRAVKVSGGRLRVGAGTVLDLESLKKALNAKATFIVTPVLVEEVVSYCVKNKIPVFPGALTPLEIYKAWQSGAAMVKVFPSGFFGPEYIKEIKGPFEKIELLVCGGVTPENMQSFFSNGASAIAFGASVFRKDLLAKKDFSGIAGNIKKFIQRYEDIEK